MMKALWGTTLLLVTFKALGLCTPSLQTFVYTFSKEENFQVGFADYPIGEERNYELDSLQNAHLPNDIHSSTLGLKISGNNHSDDLFMYAYKKIEGLCPYTTYKVNFSLTFASNASLESTGVGGSPGESVYMKLGIAGKEPKSIVSDTYYRMNIDKGNQMQDGKDMLLVGNVAVDTRDDRYRLKTLPYEPDAEMAKKLQQYTFTTNQQGEAWVVLGTDSGYESTTTLYYTQLWVSFLPKWGGMRLP